MQIKIARQLIVLLITTFLVACGFHLRGLVDIPFKTIYVQDSKTQISQDLLRALKSNNLEIKKSAEQAEVSIEILSDSTVKRILSLGGATGVVREFELLHTVTYRMRAQNEELWGPTQKIENRRDFSYDDSQVLAKTYEETMLYENMRQDAVRELLRRITVFKPGQLQAPQE